MKTKFNRDRVIELLNPYLRLSEAAKNELSNKPNGPNQHIGYEAVPLKVLQQLFDEHLIDPEETQNDSPSTKEFLTFLTELSDPLYTGTHTVHGYIIINREDERVSIEGLSSEGITDLGTVSYITSVTHHADEFNINTKQDHTSIYSWWD